MPKGLLNVSDLHRNVRFQTFWQSLQKCYGNQRFRAQCVILGGPGGVSDPTGPRILDHGSRVTGHGSRATGHGSQAGLEEFLR